MSDVLPGTGVGNVGGVNRGQTLLICKRSVVTKSLGLNPPGRVKIAGFSLEGLYQQFHPLKL